MTLVLALVLPLLALGVMYYKSVHQTNRLGTESAMEIAQLSRNIAGGKGYTTNVIRPLALKFHKDIATMPDMTTPPLYPVVQAVFMARDASDKKAVSTSALFYLLTIPVLYLLARGMFNQNAAILAVVAYTLSVGMVASALSGLPLTMATFLLTWFLYACYRFAQTAMPANEDEPVDTRSLTKWGVLAGLLLSACYLTDYALLWVCIPALFFVWRNGGKAHRAAFLGFLVAFLVPTLAWMIRNYNVTGHAVYGLRALELGVGTKDYPGTSLYRGLTAPGILEILQGDKAILFRKALASANYLFNSLPNLGQPWLAPFFIVGLFYSFRRTGVNAVRRLLLWSMLFAVVGSCTLLGSGVSLSSFIPVVLAFGAAFVVRLLTDARLPVFYSRIVSTAAVLAVAIPYLMLVYAAPTQKAMKPPVESVIASNVAPNVAIMTDRPVQMAWYGGKKAIVLPYTEDNFKDIDREQKLKVICLTSGLAPGAGLSPDWDPWKRMYYGVSRVLSDEKVVDVTEGTFQGFRTYRGVSPDVAREALVNGVIILSREGGMAKSG
jgi:4-amino-4-deoxy-L-arabinose transferase-like glycosyltransferase